MLRIATVAAAALLACSAGPGVVTPPPPPPPPPASATIRLFFIGNSLTFSYNIPGLVKEMITTASGNEPLVVSSTYANYALEDHWNGGSARSLIKAQPLDRVIMQQGPSTLPESGVELTKWSKTWSDEARRYGIRPGIYVVWPPKGGNLDAGIANHEAAATAANAALYPVGEAWREAWIVDPALPLYGPDQFHPGPHGSWLAALIISAMVLDRPVADFPNLFPTEISATQAETMRAAASKAIALYGRR